MSQKTPVVREVQPTTFVIASECGHFLLAEQPDEGGHIVEWRSRDGAERMVAALQEHGVEPMYRWIVGRP